MAFQKRIKRLRGVSRIDNLKGVHGWKVRLSRGRWSLYQFFSDAFYGGKKQSLKAAIVFKDEVISGLDARKRGPYHKGEPT